MTVDRSRSVLDRVGVVPFAFLAVILLLLGVEASGGPLVGLSVATAGLVLSAVWRVVGWPMRGGVEIVPAGSVLLYLVVVVPPTVVSEALAGLAGVATLFWIADISSRTPGRLGRALDQLIMPMAGFAVALGISFVLPTGPLSLGLASLLLVLVVMIVVLILARPSIVGRREAPSS